MLVHIRFPTSGMMEGPKLHTVDQPPMPGIPAPASPLEPTGNIKNWKGAKWTHMSMHTCLHLNFLYTQTNANIPSQNIKDMLADVAASKGKRCAVGATPPAHVGRYQRTDG